MTYVLEHPLVATSLNNLALLYQDQGKYQQAEPLYKPQSAEFRNAIQPVELSAIQAKIPKNAAMVEIVQYGPLNVLIN